jgi:large subunit ribosomal protein L22
MAKNTSTLTPASSATLWMTNCSPVRTRIVADLIRGKSLNFATTQLMLSPKVKPARMMLKLLRSAAANAAQKGTVDLDRLVVSELQVNEGPRIKRFMPRAQGRADQIVSRTSHIILKLAEKSGTSAKKAGGSKAKAKKASTKAKAGE